MKQITLCFGMSALLFLTSCTKEDTLRTNYGSPTNTIEPVHVTASNWTAASAGDWSEATIGTQTYFRMEWNAPEVTENMVNQDAVLVYAKRSGNEPELIPFMFGTDYNTETHLYGVVAQPQILQVFQRKIEQDANTTPDFNENVNFRYIAIDLLSGNNGLIEYNGVTYSVEMLKTMSYADVTAILGIASY